MTEYSRREALRMVGVATAASALAQPGMSGAQSDLITKPIPSSGERLPVVGLGTWQTFDVGSSRADRAPLSEVLRAFVQMGGKVIDSSPMYGQSESVVGDLAAEGKLHPKLFIATKVWTSGKQDGIAQMEDSMRKLRTRRIDLMQVHNLVDARTHLDTLAGWKKDGRVRYIGVTHYTDGAHDDVAAMIRRYPLDFIQINYSASERGAERSLLPLAAERRVAVIANRPFASGSLFRRTRAQALPGWAGEIGCTSWAQLALKFIVSHPAITCAIPATSKAQHMKDNMGAAYGPLPDAALRNRIAAAIG